MSVTCLLRWNLLIKDTLGPAMSEGIMKEVMSFVGKLSLS